MRPGGTNLRLLGDLRFRSQAPHPYDAYVRLPSEQSRRPGIAGAVSGGEWWRPSEGRVLVPRRFLPAAQTGYWQV